MVDKPRIGVLYICYNAFDYSTDDGIFYGKAFAEILNFVLCPFFLFSYLIYLHWQNLLRHNENPISCLLYTSPSPRDGLLSRMPSSA